MKPHLHALLLALAALPAWPQEEQQLGRLFMTPQQRSALDRQRLLGQNPTSDVDNEASFTFDGEVRRSSGKNTRWINGEPQTATTRPDIPPGDSFHPATGEHESILGDGRIVVRRKPPGP